MSHARTTPPPQSPEVVGEMQSRGEVLASALSHDGAKLAVITLCDEHALEIIELESNRTTVVPTKMVVRGGKLAFSPDGKTLALARHGIDLVDIATGATTRTFGLGLGLLDSPTFSPDGTRVSVHGPKGFATLDCKTGQVSFRLWSVENAPAATHTNKR